jgi:hypothetical protein
LNSFNFYLKIRRLWLFRWLKTVNMRLTAISCKSIWKIKNGRIFQLKKLRPKRKSSIFHFQKVLKAFQPTKLNYFRLTSSELSKALKTLGKLSKHLSKKQFKTCLFSLKQKNIPTSFARCMWSHLCSVWTIFSRQRNLWLKKG